jgi:hypothetical protein
MLFAAFRGLFLLLLYTTLDLGEMCNCNSLHMLLLLNLCSLVY